ncbi:hypothetical protein MFKK_20390 [Halopseudomonas aestusnigri]|uniref:hypothetical protein n=1 Tax=Halopseudomonas TaxID=2901189 RepID=UPI0022B6D46C|nr:MULTISPECIES: hypothetical protein [Halopseudomonas]BDX19229.1 hypothetical protein MFKK_20390 [Halopseudomonas aestusnigri]
MINDSKRSSRASEGIKALHALLTLVCQKPFQFKNDQELRTSLKSQSSLAKIHRKFELETGEKLATHPMSLNTLKTHSNAVLNGGFKILDDLRISATSALDRADKREKYTNKRTKSGLNRRVQQLEQELEMQRQTNMLLLRSISESIHQFTSIQDASDEKIRKKRTQDALQTIRAILSMNLPPFNVIPVIAEPTKGKLVVTNIDDYR